MGDSKKPYVVYVSDDRLPQLYPIVFNATQETYDSSVNVKLKSDDILVTSYPKCGTTWTMYALYLLRSGGILPPGNLDTAIPFLEWGGGETTDAIKETPRIIKTHLYWEIVPKNETAKYVFVARNPKDCVVSFFHHTVGFGGYKFQDGKFNDYFEQFIIGDVDSGDYFNMVGKWFEQSKTNKNILFILYEDMKDNFQRELRKIAAFWGDEWSEKLNKNEGKLMEIILNETCFANMNKRTQLFCDTARPKDKPFVRKGIIGDWRNMLSQEQSKRIDDRILDTAKLYPGFDQIWAKYKSMLE